MDRYYDMWLIPYIYNLYATTARKLPQKAGLNMPPPAKFLVACISFCLTHQMLMRYISALIWF